MRNACLWCRAAILGALLLGCGPNGGASDAGAPASDAGATATQGYLAVQFRKCGQCHQSPVPGDGVLSGQGVRIPGSQSYGANLTPDPDTGMDAWDAGSIAAAVLYGVANQGAPLCPTMPTFADAGMSSDEAFAIGVYLQSLVAVRHVVPASTCPSLGAQGDAGL